MFQQIKYLCYIWQCIKRICLDYVMHSQKALHSDVTCVSWQISSDSAVCSTACPEKLTPRETKKLYITDVLLGETTGHWWFPFTKDK